MNMLTKTYLVSPPFHEDNHSELLLGLSQLYPVLGTLDIRGRVIQDGICRVLRFTRAFGHPSTLISDWNALCMAPRLKIQAPF